MLLRGKATKGGNLSAALRALGRGLRHLGGERPGRRVLSLLMLYIFLISQNITLIQSLRAETGGATAPEVTKFEPVDTTDLVNLASGDFSYSIPVINVPGPEGGYPLALGYHAGIQHGEDASWVGLGWNLQPGSISRAVVGYPDDFSGVGISTNYKSNVYETYSVGVTFMFVEAGVSYTTYKGFSGYVGLSFQVGYSLGAASASAGVSIVANISSEGVGVTASASASISVGGSSVGVTAQTDSSGHSSVKAGSSLGISIPGKNAGGDGFGHTATDMSQGHNFSSASGSFSSYSGNGNHTESFGVGINLGFIGFNVGYSRTWIDKDESEYAYGYYHHTDAAGPNESQRINEWVMETDPNAVPGDSKEHALAPGLHYLASNDGYAVMGEGTGGDLKLTRLEDRVYRPKKLEDEWDEGSGWPWPAGADMSRYKARFVFEGDNAEAIPFPDAIGLSRSTLSAMVPDPVGGATSSQIDQGNFPSSDPSSYTAKNLFLGKAFVPGSRLVKETLGSDGMFSAFDVWEADGRHYTFGEPVRNLSSTSISANSPTIGSGEWFRSLSTINKPYAYAWYLSSVRYPDYYDVNGNGPDAADEGGWVTFGYVTGSPDYHWHSSSDGQLNDGPINRVDKLGKDKAGMMYSMQSGVKELKYLNHVETATHVAYFVTSPRLDSHEIPARPASYLGTLTSNQGSTSDYSFAFTPTNASLIGLSIPDTDASGVSLWGPVTTQTSTIHDGSLCEGAVDTTNSYVYKNSGQVFSLNGIPLVIRKITKQVVTSHFINTWYNDENVGTDFCDSQTSTGFVAEINTADQFWANSPYAAFPELQYKWQQTVAQGGITAVPSSMLKLDDIYLIEKSTGRLVKQVHFYYSYRLAPGTPNSVSGTEPSFDATGHVVLDGQGHPILTNPNPGHGKLTLEAVQTFGEGGMADPSVQLPPYRFEYASNPAWGNKYDYDRWGNFKSNGGPWNHRDVNGADQSAWSLTKMTLPTGGTLQIQYEPKDYTRVQDRVPLNPRANAAQVAQYMADLDPWVNTTPWPLTDQDWTAFRLRVYGDSTHAPTPFHVFSPQGGTLADGTHINAVQGSSLPSASQSRIPIESAPNPKDLKLWLMKTEPPTGPYHQNLIQAQKVSGMNLSPDLASQVSDVATPLSAAAAGASTSAAPVERMVNVVFEYWTAGGRAQKALAHPLHPLSSDDIGNASDDDRGDRIVHSVLARMVRKKKSDGSDDGMDLFITDPTFDWPKEAPDSMYVTWTANSSTPKLGGGVRVKRIVSFDGRRSYTTSYTYTDFIDGVWTSSGVAAQEPPPFGYSAMDDRVIYTEKGGWAHEGGGGIYHSRVVVRHSWSEDPAPAGALENDGTTRASSPMGETVFRFITPKDLPHGQRDVDYAKTVTDSNGNVYTNSARLTEIFNVGAWWGKLLWKEDRDSQGRPLNRVENRYTQLEGYLRTFPDAGFDPDVEYQWGAEPRKDMSFHWADNQTTLADGSTPPNMPLLVNDTPANKGLLGQDYIRTTDPNQSALTADAFRGYLNGSVNVTLIHESVNSRNVPVRNGALQQWKTSADDPSQPVEDEDSVPVVTNAQGWHSSVTGVREINFAPLVSEVRTYGEGLKLLSVVRNTVWDRRTGALLEKETRGRRTQTPTDPNFETDLHDPFAFHDRTISRTWPAYWVYPGMDQRPDISADWKVSDIAVMNMLTQIAETTTLRETAVGTPIFLNSKVDTWWQPEGATRAVVPPGTLAPISRWVKGGEFVWNGLGTGSKPPVFPGFPSAAGQTGWTPGNYSPANIQPYKASDWLFAGATTKYDAFAHPLEAVDSDGVFGCSKYGYPYDDAGNSVLPSGNFPIAKFSNAADAETLYWNFEGNGVYGAGPLGTSRSTSEDPIARLSAAYSGERAYAGTLGFSAPAVVQSDGYELRYFVKSASQAAALASCAGVASWKSAVPAEGGWWFVRAKVANGAAISLSGSAAAPLDDVCVFPWRKNGAPGSVSHFSYDRTLGLVTSITGSNGRTTRYKYDHLGRLETVYDVYGKPVAATRYGNVASTAVAP